MKMHRVVSQSAARSAALQADEPCAERSRHYPSLLLVGTLPPPTGGVTVHTARLLGRLRDDGFDPRWFDYRRHELSALPGHLRGVRWVHLHLSNPYALLLAIGLGRAARRRVMFTCHGSFDRWAPGSKRAATRAAARLADAVIVLDEVSRRKASELNGNVHVAGAFIPSSERTPLAPDVLGLLRRLRSEFPVMCCTNAWDVSLSESGEEIYGIVELVEAFRGLAECALVIANPSGRYREFLDRHGRPRPANVHVITGDHAFTAVLEQCDAMVRNTSTDGDSLSVKEALYLGKRALATDVVPRPPGVSVYRRGDVGAIRRLVRATQDRADAVAPPEDCYESIRAVYRALGLIEATTSVARA